MLLYIGCRLYCFNHSSAINVSAVWFELTSRLIDMEKLYVLIGEFGGEFCCDFSQRFRVMRDEVGG